jgi:LysM repeat protein
MNRFLVCFATLCFTINTKAQKDVDIRAYIAQYSTIAIEEMKRNAIPASITIAQGIHESAAGKSKLAQNSNNHFGIKCHKDWQGKGYHHDDDKPQECFRVYENPEESFRDHSKFLLSRVWYKPLFALNIADYKGWAHGLKKAGYATNPKYADIIIDLIEKYELHKLDVRGTIKSTEQFTQVKETLPTDNVPCGNDVNINGVRGIVFDRGGTIEDICKCAGISTFQLYLFNDADVRYSFKQGETIFLAPKKNTSAQNQYTTENEISLRDISQKFGIQLLTLLKYNNKSSDRIVPQGTLINLNDPATIAADETKQNAIYAVKKGDTLYSIARMFDMKPEDLKRINNLEDVNLSIGQTLNIAQP